MTDIDDILKEAKKENITDIERGLHTYKRITTSNVNTKNTPNTNVNINYQKREITDQSRINNNFISYPTAIIVCGVASAFIFKKHIKKIVRKWK
jgi:hypothetical protein